MATARTQSKGDEMETKTATTSIVSSLGKRFSDVTIAMHQAIARKAGLSGTDHKYLNFLIEHGPMPAGGLAKLTGLTTGAVTAVIDRLEKQKLVKRQLVKNDRRKVIIVPDTDNINKMLGPHFRLLRNRITGLVSLLTEKEKKIVGKYMTDVIRVMEELTVELSGGNS